MEFIDRVTTVMGDEIYRNYQRNKKLIDLSETPDTIKEKIINNFETQDPTPPSKIFPYLVSKQCRMLLESVQEFI